MGGVLARASMSKMAGVEWVKGHFREGKYVPGYRREEAERKPKKEFAPGLPDKKRITPFPQVSENQSQIWEFGVHDHHAVRAGRHFDLRLGDPSTHIAHSWAIPKSKLPEPGEKLLAVRQPDHTVAYMDFKGMLPEGYGYGKVGLHKRGKTEITFSDERMVKFNLYEGREISEYVLVRTGGPTKWLLQNVTPTRQARPDLPSSKPKYRETKPEKIDLGRESEILQAKVDGAHVLVDMKPGKQTRVFSYRPTERKTGVIDHTQRIPGVLGHRADKETGNTILRGEVYATDKDGKAIPAQDVGGMLNANVWKSRLLQEEKGPLTTAIFDVVKHKGKPAEDLPYSEKLRILKEISEREGDLFHLPDTAETKEDKEKLYKDIQEKKHKQTSEGVIVWKKDESFPPTKVKHRPDFDVYVRKIFPAYGKDGKELDRAGGFAYSWEPDGEIVGRVGTGFDHKMLKDMKSDPGKYVGRVAKVLSMEKMRGRGALRAPSFSEWHTDKGKEAAAWGPSKIHKLADKLGIAWDDDPKFKKFSKEATGVSCIDEMSPSQRKSLASALVRRVAGGGEGLTKAAAKKDEEPEWMQAAPAAGALAGAVRGAVKGKGGAKARATEALLSAVTGAGIGWLPSVMRKGYKTVKGKEKKSSMSGQEFQGFIRELRSGRENETLPDHDDIQYTSENKLASLKRNPFAPQLRRMLVGDRSRLKKKIQRQLQSAQATGRQGKKFNPRTIYGPDKKTGNIRV